MGFNQFVVKYAFEEEFQNVIHLAKTNVLNAFWKRFVDVHRVQHWC